MSRDMDRELDEALRALGEESSHRQAPARVEAALRREFRRRTPWFAVAAAAVVLAAVLLAAWRPAEAPVAYRPIATEFLPVAYGQPFRLEEGGRIVRVRVPRSTMASFGLPVNQERLSERIQADVLLGEDNLVRAIRFEQ